MTLLHNIQVPWTWTYPLLQPKQSKRDMRFGTWNVMSVYSSRSLTTAARVLARYKLDLVGDKDLTWDKGGMVRAGDYIFF